MKFRMNIMPLGDIPTPYCTISYNEL